MTEKEFRETYPPEVIELMLQRQEEQGNPKSIEPFLKDLDRSRDLDLVVSTAPIKNVPVGTIGTVVHDYGNNETFEVEFFQNHKTIAVETVSKNQIQKRIVDENA